MAVEFKAIAAEALARATVLLPQWIQGERHGREWLGGRRANGGPGDSWSVNLETGNWLHGAGDERGGDLVSLYAALNGVDQLAALHQVAELVGHTELPINVLPARSRAPVPEREHAWQPIPPNPPPIIDEKLGAPVHVAQYEDKFAVARFEPKTFRQFTWRRGKWSNQGFPDERPLYRQSELAKHPRKPVLVVEGERCADAAAILDQYVVVTWSQGASSVKKTDWTILRDRTVIIWPDADQAGSNAAAAIVRQLHGISRSTVVLRITGQAQGWDVSDAIADGWDAHRLTEFIHAARPKQEILPPADPNSEFDTGSVPRSVLVVYRDLDLDCDTKTQIPHPTLSNVSMIMRFHPKLKGQIWWDEFCERIYHTLRGPMPQEWNDLDTARLTAFIQQTLELNRFSLKLVKESIIHAAHENSRNSVKDWLEGIQWDGYERLSTWVGDCLGVELTPYSMAVARNWLISMVARVYKPGCQVDTMPVLEGLQGEGKSSALEILGGQWYAAVGTAFGSYDFIQTIQGKWLIEIPDMAGFSKREHSHVIATITTRTDRYRMKYGHFDQDHPRKCVFAATSETDDYLVEMRGHRRYWPLRCNGIDLDALRFQREQLFAEALIAYRAGAGHHKMPTEETTQEQRARADDLWTTDVMNYCEQFAMAGLPVHPAAILVNSDIKLEHKHLDQHSKLRVVNILKAHGWIAKTVNNQRQYVKPKRVQRNDPETTDPETT